MWDGFSCVFEQSEVVTQISASQRWQILGSFAAWRFLCATGRLSFVSAVAFLWRDSSGWAWDSQICWVEAHCNLNLRP